MTVTLKVQSTGRFKTTATQLDADGNTVGDPVVVWGDQLGRNDHFFFMPLDGDGSVKVETVELTDEMIAERDGTPVPAAAPEAEPAQPRARAKKEKSS